MWEKTRQAWLGSTREADVGRATLELKFDVGERMRETDRQNRVSWPGDGKLGGAGQAMLRLRLEGREELRSATGEREQGQGRELGVPSGGRMGSASPQARQN